jgi:hypothetical protein
MANIFDIGKINRLQNTYQVRQERIKREGSPYYTWVVPVTATTASSAIHVPTQFPASAKYEPLDWVEIVNNDPACNLTLTINDGETFPIPIGTIRTIDGKALWSLRITNNGGVNTTINLIIATLRRQPMTIDKWSRQAK